VATRVSVLGKDISKATDSSSPQVFYMPIYTVSRGTFWT
jgi:hypothetical protein